MDLKVYNNDMEKSGYTVEQFVIINIHSHIRE